MTRVDPSRVSLVLDQTDDDPVFDSVQMACSMCLFHNDLKRTAQHLSIATAATLLIVLPGCQSGRGMFWARRDKVEDAALAEIDDSLDALVDSSVDSLPALASSRLPEGFSPPQIANAPIEPVAEQDQLIHTASMTDEKDFEFQLVSSQEDSETTSAPAWASGADEVATDDADDVSQVTIQPRPTPSRKQNESLAQLLLDQEEADAPAESTEITEAQPESLVTEASKPAEEAADFAADFAWAEDLKPEAVAETAPVSEETEQPLEDVEVTFDFELAEAAEETEVAQAESVTAEQPAETKPEVTFEPEWSFDTGEETVAESVPEPKVEVTTAPTDSVPEPQQVSQPESVASDDAIVLGVTPKAIERIGELKPKQATWSFASALGKAAPKVSQLQVSQRKSEPVLPLLAKNDAVAQTKTLAKKPASQNVKPVVKSAALEQLIHQIDQADEKTRPALVMHLLMFPTLSEVRTDYLAELTEHEDQHSAAIAQIALALEGKGGQDFGSVADLLKSGDEDLATKAAYLISKVTSDSPLVQQLPAGLESESQMVQVHAAEGLFQHGLGDDNAWFVLADAATDAKAETQQLAISALGTIRKVHAEDTIDLLEQIMQNEEVPIQVAAVLALGQFKQQAKRSLPHLMELAEQTDSIDVKRAVLLTVKRIQVVDQHVADVQPAGWRSRGF